MTLAELIQERAHALTQATELAAKVRGEDRDLNTEERALVENVTARVAELDMQIAKLEEERAAAAQSQAALDSLLARANDRTQRRSAPPVDNRGRRGKPVNVLETPEYCGYFNAVMRRDHAEASRIANDIEARALSLGTDAAGGYLVLPTDIAGVLIQQIDELSGVTGMCTKHDIGEAKSLGVEKVATRGDDADWTTEVASVTEEASLALGRRDLTPVMLTKVIKASMRLVSRSPRAQEWILSEMARKFAVTFEKGILSGSGSSQPLGLFTASSNGISTGRDVTCASTTAFTYSELMQFKYNLKAPYLNDPSFGLFVHRDFMRKALTLLDGNNRPIFIPAPGVGLQDTVLGMPIKYSEYAPDTYSAGNYVAVAGAMRHYWLVGGMQYSVQIVDQLFAGTNQIAYYGRTEADGSPVLEEAFTRLKLAAS